MKKQILQYKKTLSIKPNLAEAYYGLAVCYNQLGRVDDEIQAYKRTLAIEPDMLAALTNLGNAYFTKENYDAAIIQYKKAARIKPNEGTIFYNLGAAYSNKGDYEKAVAEYAKAVEIDPENADAHNGLAYGFYMLKKLRVGLGAHKNSPKELGADIDKKLLDAIETNLQ